MNWLLQPLSPSQVVGVVCLVAGLIGGLWYLVAFLTTYDARIVIATKPTTVLFPPCKTYYTRGLTEAETDRLFDTSPAHLTELFGTRVREDIRLGRDPYHRAFLAAHFAHQAYPWLTPSETIRVPVITFPDRRRRTIAVEKVH